MTTILLALLVGFALTQIANMATTVYLHRCLTHRAVTLSTPLTAAFRTTISLLTGIRPRQWAAVHRKHHAFTDEIDDPHSPVRLGWVRVQLTNSATNLQWLAVFTRGEGVHNNHHAAPTSARFSIDPGQIDPGWWVIRFARRLRLARVRHEEPVFATPRRISA